MFIYVYIYMYELFHVSNLYWGLKIFAPCFRANSSEPSCESNQVTRQKHLTKVPQNGWFIINGKPYEQMGWFGGFPIFLETPIYVYIYQVLQVVTSWVKGPIFVTDLHGWKRDRNHLGNQFWSRLEEAGQWRFVYTHRIHGIFSYISHKNPPSM